MLKPLPFSGASGPFVRGGRVRPLIDPSTLRHWLWLLGLWAGLPLLALAAFAITGETDGRWGRLIVAQLGFWLPWLFLSWMIDRGLARYPLRGTRRLRHWWGHLVASLLLSGGLAVYLVQFESLLASRGLRGLQEVGTLLRQAGLPVVVISVGLYWIVVGVLSLARFVRRHRERESMLTEARLQVLQAQLRPHFLFNTLNTASALMEVDVGAARTVLARLADLLRASLGGQGQHTVPLARELEILTLYLEIEKVRFQDRLVVRTEVERSIAEAQVPYLLLQPLVENAVRHGIGARSDASTIVVRAYRREDRLRLEVEDDGPGPSAEWKEGVGLANTRARLRELFGSSARMTLATASVGRGAIARVEIPFEPSRVRG